MSIFIEIIEVMLHIIKNYIRIDLNFFFFIMFFFSYLIIKMLKIQVSMAIS